MFQIMRTVNNEQESIMVSEEHFVCESSVIDDWTYSEDDGLFLLEGQRVRTRVSPVAVYFKNSL